MSDPHARQYPGFRVESGTSCAAQGKVDYSVTTDNNQGLVFYENGNLIIRNKASSHELCGEHLTDNITPAKTIDAANGDIHIRAKNGTIILEAANIRLVGVDGIGGEISLGFIYWISKHFGLQAAYAGLAYTSASFDEFEDSAAQGFTIGGYLTNLILGAVI